MKYLTVVYNATRHNLYQERAFPVSVWPHIARQKERESTKEKMNRLIFMDTEQACNGL
jgi:hypothetical protein